MMCNSERGPGRNGSPGTTSIGGSELFLFGSQVRHMAEGFFLGAVHSGTSLGITGEMNLDCEMTHEQDIYSDEGPPGEPAPPRTITAHTRLHPQPDRAMDPGDRQVPEIPGGESVVPSVVDDRPMTRARPLRSRGRDAFRGRAFDV